MLELSAKSITDEMLAISALRAMVTAPSAGGQQLLTTDSLPGLRVIIRMVFSEMMLQLTDVIESCDIDAENSEASSPYSDSEPLRLAVQLPDEDKLSSGMLLTVKRQMEHAVAAGVLAWVASSADADFTQLLQAQRDGAIAALREVLTPVAVPLQRVGWP